MTFEMWSTFHYIYIVSPFVLLFILLFISKNKSFEQKRVLGIILSTIATILLILRNVEIYLERGFDAEIIPLQICHLANFIMLFSFVFKNKTLFALSFALNLPAAFMSVIFANSLTNYETILTFRGAAYIFGHMMIVSIILWAFFEGFIEMNKKIFIKSVITILILYIFLHITNNLLALLDITPNYFYTLLPEYGTPLEIFYNLGTNYQFGIFTINPVYIGLSALLGLIVLFIFYGLYFLLKPLIRKESEHFRFLTENFSYQ